MKREKKALLMSLVIGDGFIRTDTRSNSNKSSLKLCHSIHQEEYIKYKAKLLHTLLGGKEPVIRHYVCKWPDGTTYQQVRAEKAHRYFRVLKNWLYPNKYNVKYLKYLTPQALAIWFMDDGSIIANNRYKDGTCSSARTNIHLCTSKEQAEGVCKYFEEYWKIKFTPFLERGNYSIRCFHKEGKKFHELIHQYIIPSMSYKQRFYYPTSAQPLDAKGDDIV